MSSIGEKVISLGRLYSCFLGGEGVSSVSRSSEKTFPVASTGFAGSNSQSLSRPETVWSDRRLSGVLCLLPSPNVWPRCVASGDNVAPVFREGIRISSSSLFISSASSSSSRLSRLSQLGISGSVSFSRLNCMALLPVPLRLSWASAFKVSHSRVDLMVTPCWLTGGLPRLVTGGVILQETVWEGASGLSNTLCSLRGVRRSVMLSLYLANRPIFSALSSSTALRQELFTSRTLRGKR